jgi:predicted acylesterase/phospholipase RssA
VAPFAYLGSEFDARLKEAYTTLTTKDILKRRGTIATLRSDAAADTAPLRAHIARYVDDEVIAAIAREHRRGRQLIIGTVNLDAMRPVLWNIGAIAASGRKDAADLIHTILIASASIPGAFPPQFITVEAKGVRYDEMHVDGGTVHQAFLYPMGYNWDIILKRLQVKGKPEVYIIRNGRLSPEYKAVDPAKTLHIAGRAASSLILSSGVSDLYRMYLTSLRDGLNYHWTAIPDDFNMKSKGMFDPDYMQKLLEVGYQRVVSGTAWQSEPPDYKLKR